MIFCMMRLGSVDNYNDPDNIRNCNLLGLPDLYGASDYVRETVASYLNQLVDLGVAGVRIDSARHMWPADLWNITDRVKTLPTAYGFANNSKLFVYSDVIDLNFGVVNVTEYYDIGNVSLECLFKMPKNLSSYYNY